MTLTFGSLFAGIGGFDLGFERAGMVCRWQVEIDPFASRVLAKHWPDVHRERDIKECGAHNLEQVDVVCGGFPCQNISHAGLREGITGEQSSLWKEYLRIVRVLRPNFVVVENVSALLDRDLGVILGDLASIGYDAEWETISAARFGSYQIRERVFVLAYPNCNRWPPKHFASGIVDKRVSQTDQEWCGLQPQPKRSASGRIWAMPPSLFQRMVDGIFGGLDKDRLKAVGNSVCPQIAEWIGRQIVERFQ